MKIKIRVTDDLKLKVISKGLNARSIGIYSHLGFGQEKEFIFDKFSYIIVEGEKYVFNIFRKKRLFGDVKLTFTREPDYYLLESSLAPNWRFCKGMFKKVLHTLKIKSKKKKVSFYVSMEKVK